jgi:excisionase family DNA binding protein
MQGGSNKLLTPQQVGELLGLPARSIRDYAKQWGIPCYRIGRTVRYRARDIENFIEKRKEPAQ